MTTQTTKKEPQKSGRKRPSRAKTTNSAAQEYVAGEHGDAPTSADNPLVDDKTNVAVHYDIDPAETAVRNYLAFLADRSSLVDHDAIAKAQERLNTFTDPVDRLRALAELERLKNPDGTELQKQFVANARAWAASQGIPGSAFSDLGVSADVLHRAGLLRAKGKPRAGMRLSGKRVSVPDIVEWISVRQEPFTIRMIHDTLGGSLVTIAKAIRQMQSEGTVVETDKTMVRTSGRAPAMYQLAPNS